MTGSTACPSCGVTGRGMLEAGVPVTVGAVAAVLLQRPLSTCSEHPGTPIGLGEAARRASGEQLVFARRRRRGAAACRNCRATLDLPGRRTVRMVTVVSEPAPVHTLRLDLPMMRCPGCATDQLPWQVRGDLTAAIDAAYQTPADG